MSLITLFPTDYSVGRTNLPCNSVYQSMFKVFMPSCLAGDIVEAMMTFTVTNQFSGSQNIGVGRRLAISQNEDHTIGPLYFTAETTENVTPAQHHKAIHDYGATIIPSSGDWWMHGIGWAMTDDVSYIVVESPGYGGMFVKRFRN